jgi:hypothetical protein
MKISCLEKGTITNDEEKQKLEYFLKVDKDKKRNFLQIVCEINEENVLLKLELTVYVQVTNLDAGLMTRVSCRT